MSNSARLPFHVLVKPNGPICNLACEYCFYLEKQDLYPGNKRFRMSDATLEDFTRQYIAAQPSGVAEVNFAWQGGEPTLMGLDFFRKAVALQEKHGRSGMRITNALQTNATLLDDAWGRFLCEHNFLVGISIDGPEELHDRYRPDKRGCGSFRRVMAGLDVLKKHRVDFNTLTAVQRSNSKHPVRVYDFLRDIGSTFMQFIPIVEPDGEGSVSRRSVLPARYGRFLNSVFDHWCEHDIGTVFVQLFDVLLGIVAGHGASLCVHAPTCGRNVAVEHNGDVYSCDHFVFAEYLQGNISTRPIAAIVDHETQAKFGLDKTDTLSGQCQRCQFLRLCYGGCPAHRLATPSRRNSDQNYLCKGYKMFYGHALPSFLAMVRCLRRGRPARDYRLEKPIR